MLGAAVTETDRLNLVAEISPTATFCYVVTKSHESTQAFSRRIGVATFSIPSVRCETIKTLQTGVLSALRLRTSVATDSG